MSSTVAALPPPSHPVPHKAEYEDGTDVPEYAFSDLWQDRKEGLTFGDVLDIINPLQHIPVVSTIYRMATGDEIGVGSRLLGGALFGGPLGVFITGLTTILEDISGGSVEKHVASLWNGLSDDGTATSQIAATTGKNSPDPARPVLAASQAAAAILLAQATGGSRPAAGPDPAAATSEIILSPLAGVSQPSPQPLPRPPVTVSPMTAVHRTHSRPPQPATADGTVDSQRIAKAIEQAQRAQAGLLLANLGANSVEVPQDNGGERTNASQIQPFKSHPYMLPRGAPPQLISRAMEQALMKYQTTLQQRAGAVSTPPPAPAPIP